MATLPLFPLGTVLMPGARLPLQIFEPRYVQLLKDLLDGQDQRPPVFGVVAIREGFEVGEDGVRALHPVGCGALLTQAAALEGERYLVVSEGTDRFHVDAIDESAGTPYTTGPHHLAARGPTATRPRSSSSPPGCVPSWPRSPQPPGPSPSSPRTTASLAYAVSETVSLDVEDRQRLLSSTDTESRLRLGLQLVRREREFASAAGRGRQPPIPPFSLN